ncbi:hypothetical protein [Cytobacillus oceanisediminis]|uniref:hypothetical protein n=1 Tax=Cytobacillus oceanisediminis TaxID=665099 RepID=UPI00203E240F|nr:hypothetical protein [Cytobacillus oceanisediminis]MCM3402957.1 hypothetical protein [Cytobacillus oceanisediminis]
MYFIDEEHKANYHWLMDKYNLSKNEDAQYESSIYVCAVPYVFEAIAEGEMDISVSPAFTAMKFSEEEGRHIPSHHSLTGTSRALLEFAVSCYNGYRIGIDDLIASNSSDEYFNVIIQAMKIRAKKA